jgi:hypothetical protein
MVSYYITDIYNIKKDDQPFNLSDDIKQKIIDITNKVSSPDYIKTPIFKKSLNDWETIRNFKPTEISTSNQDNIINNIRLLINKLSDETFDVLSIELYELINNTLEAEANIDKLDNVMFNAIYNNSYYIKHYAMVYLHLINKNDLFKANFKTFMNDYNHSYETIEPVSCDDNYENFCEYKKKNVKRCAGSNFIIHMMKNGYITKPDFLELIMSKLIMFNDFISDVNKKEIVSILSQNIYILITEGFDFTCSNEIDIWNDILTSVTIICEYDTIDYPGLSSKVSFKFEEIIEHLEKASNH